VAATGFHRKYVLGLMRKPLIVRIDRADKFRKSKYGPAVRQALMMTWNALCKTLGALPAGVSGGIRALRPSFTARRR
jgi:hypothetical protein